MGSKKYNKYIFTQAIHIWGIVLDNPEKTLPVAFYEIQFFFAKYILTAHSETISPAQHI